MSRLVLVDDVADAPPAAPDTTVVVLDAAWTPMPGERPDLLPIRPIVQSILDKVDVNDDSLAALDAWAAAAGLPEAFAADGVPWWYRARMLLRWDVHELVLWRLVLDRLADGRTHEAITLPFGRPGLLLAARAPRVGPGAGGATPMIEVIGRRPPARRFLRRNRRRLSELLARLRPAPRTLGERTAALEGRLDTLAREGGGVLALAWPRAFQVVREGGRERWVDPYLVGALDRIDADGERVTTIGLSLDHEDDADWSLVERDARLLPERFLVDRAASGEGGARGGAAESDETPMTETGMTDAIARSASVRHLVNGVDIGPALADLVAGYAGRWLDRQRGGFRAAQATLRELRPAVLFTDREASRTGWLAAARLAGVPSVTVQHGMIYPNSPEYFQARHAGRVRPNVTCVFGEYERDLLVGQAGFEPESVVVTGSPRPLAPDGGAEPGDRDAVRRELGIRDGDRLLLVSVAHNEVLGELHTFGLLERTLGGPLPGIHIVIKLHPQDQGEPRHDVLLQGLAVARGYETPRLSIVKDLDLYRLLGAADAHLGQYSTVLSDAVVAGTPNMIAVGQAHADSLGYVGAGVATPVRTVDDVRAFVTDPRPADPAARRAFLDAHYRPGDGAGRLADVLRGALAAARAGGEGTAGSDAGPGAGPGNGPRSRRDRGNGMKRTVAVIQARTGSTRLPGKVLLPLLSEPVLTHVMRRVARALTVDEVVVATTRLPADDPIAALAAREEWPVVRGSETDLLERYLQAATSHGADLVVRVTSDCPLIDPGLIDEVVGALVREGGDYASNTLEPRTYPRGLDVEVVTTEALQVADREDRDPGSREHATPWIRTHPERFGLVRVAGSVDHSAHRWTLDTPEDYELLRRVYEAIGHDRFRWGDVLAVVEENPAWSALNRHVPQKAAPGA